MAISLKYMYFLDIFNLISDTFRAITCFLKTNYTMSLFNKKAIVKVIYEY